MHKDKSKFILKGVTKSLNKKWERQSSPFGNIYTRLFQKLKKWEKQEATSYESNFP